MNPLFLFALWFLGFFALAFILDVTLAILSTAARRRAAHRDILEQLRASGSFASTHDRGRQIARSLFPRLRYRPCPAPGEQLKLTPFLQPRPPQTLKPKS